MCFPFTRQKILFGISWIISTVRISKPFNEVAVTVGRRQHQHNRRESCADSGMMAEVNKGSSHQRTQTSRSSDPQYRPSLPQFRLINIAGVQIVTQSQSRLDRYELQFAIVYRFAQGGFGLVYWMGASRGRRLRLGKRGAKWCQHAGLAMLPFVRLCPCISTSCRFCSARSLERLQRRDGNAPNDHDGTG